MGHVVTLKTELLTVDSINNEAGEVYMATQDGTIVVYHIADFSKANIDRLKVGARVRRVETRQTLTDGRVGRVWELTVRA